jgi:hypothetical protein
VITVPQGTYELNVNVPGFKAFQQTGIPVIEGQASRRNVRLELGQATEVITVTDQQQLLKTESGEISYRVTSSLVNQLPVLPLGAAGGMGNIRNPAYMMTVLPGVSYATAANTPGVFFQTMTVNGLPANSQTITLEGQDATPSLWRGVTSDRVSGAAIDAIEAVQVQTSNFAAEFGKAGGAAINYTMKSGTNQYHGSVFNYWVNEFMHAGTPYTDYADQNNPATAYKSGQHIRNKQRRFDYGGTFGGPIKIPGLYNGQDKSFFFFNIEQFRQTLNIANGTATVPTDAYRVGDFRSAGCNNFNLTTKVCEPGGRPIINSSITGQEALDVLGNPIINGGVYDTNSYQIVNGQPVRTYLANQQLPLALFDDVSKKIQGQFPAPTNQNLTNNYAIPAYNQNRTNTIPSVKLNHNFNSTWRMDGYYGWQASDSNNTNGFEKEVFPWTSQQVNPLRSHTIRVNLDASLTPTLLLHIGVGYYHYREPNVANKYDQSLIGLPKLGAVNAFSAADVYPTIAGISGGGGGFSPAIGASFDATAWEQKPTANLNLTWIKNNHTFKFGGDTTLEGYITHNKWRANGNFAFGSQQSGNPWTNGQALSANNPTGFAYASFLQGQPDSMSLAQTSYTRLGGHAFAFFMQDNWKVTPKLTVEYGIRYDFQTYLREQHGRHASAAFDVFNPTVGRPGGIAYEATCDCNLSSNYKLAFGPRVNVAYQITPKTVFRAGGGINYNVVQTPAGNNFSVGDFYQINSPGFGLSSLPLGLEGGNTFYPGNPYGNTPVIWPVFDPGRIPPRTSAGLPPSSPFSMYHPDSKPGRIFQWSVGLQHEVIRNLVIEASYVGNRGAWFYAPLTDTMATNSLAGPQLARFGLDIRNPADRTLLGAVVIGSAQAAQRGFYLPYVGMPTTTALGQALKPIPQWNTVNPYLGPYRGNTWYDSLQFQATKRYSHNIDLTANVTWAHGSALGASADTDFFFAGRPQVTDPFNRANQKQLNQLVSPLKTVISGTYITPALPWRNGFTGKLASMIVKDWQVGVVLQYQSGQLLGVPTSNNGLTGQLRIAPPAAFGGYNPWNYTPGTPFFREGFDPNGEFDPRAGGFYGTTGNPAASVVSVLTGGFQTINGVVNQCGAAQQAATTCAWTDAAAGEWGATAPYLEGFRWRRRPSESLNIGRNFRFGKDGRYIFNVRGEFQNILNRMFYSAPATGNPTSAVVSTTVPSTGYRYAFAGYGVVSTFNGAGSSPRQGTVVMRLTF